MQAADGSVLVAEASLENEPRFLFDALVLPDGEAAVAALAVDVHTMAFITDQYRHGKTILALGASSALLDQAGLPEQLSDGSADPGLLKATRKGVAAGVKALVKSASKKRHTEREALEPAPLKA